MSNAPIESSRRDLSIGATLEPWTWISKSNNSASESLCDTNHNIFIVAYGRPQNSRLLCVKIKGLISPIIISYHIVLYKGGLVGTRRR